MDGLSCTTRYRPCWLTLALALPLLQLTTAGPANLQASQTQSAAALYAQHCAGCHRRGAGVPVAKPDAVHPRRLNCAMISLMSDPTLFLIIKEGGPAAGLTAAMPGYGGKLRYEQMAELLHFVREICASKSGRDQSLPLQASKPQSAEAAATMPP